MTWAKGTLLEAIDDYFVPPKINLNKPLRIPLYDVYKVGGIGTVVVYLFSRHFF